MPRPVLTKLRTLLEEIQNQDDAGPKSKSRKRKALEELNVLEAHMEGQKEAMEGQKEAKRAYKETKKAYEETKKEYEETKKALEKTIGLLEQENRNYVVQLAQHQSVSQTRPILEVRLQHYNQNRGRNTSYTKASHDFENETIFEPSGSLQPWARETCEKFEKHLHCKIMPGSREFHEALWDLYKDLSRRHHSTGGFTTGVGLVIQTPSPVQTGAVVLLMCALRLKGYLPNIQIRAEVEGKAVIITKKGKLKVK